MRAYLLLLYILLYQFSSAAENPVASKGELDLTNWNPKQLPTISLAGEWRFYWQELLSASQLNSRAYSLAQLTIPWNEQEIDGKVLSKNGYATYALQIKLPPSINEVAFAVPAVFNSYAFWVDDKLICNSGQVGKSEAETTPRWQPQTVRVKVTSPSVVVLFQIANFQNTRGGCAEVMRMGDAEYLSWLSDVYHTTGKTLVAFCALLFIGGIAVYYLTEAKGYLHLAFLCFAYMLRFLFSDLYLATDFEIDLPWIAAAKIEYATVPLIVFTAATFISGIYPKEFKRAARIFFQVSSAIALLSIVLIPSEGLTPILLLLQVLGLSLSVYCSISILRAVVINRSGAWVTALSMVMFIIVASYNLYAFIMVLDLNRAFIHIGYASAISLAAFSLMYRTPLRLKQEDSEMLRYEDLYGKE